MDTYSMLREFADSWALLAMALIFVGVVLWTLRPGSRPIHDDAARIPLRNDAAPAASGARQKNMEAGDGR